MPIPELAARNPPLALADPTEFAAWIAAPCGSCPDEFRQITLANLGWGDLSAELADELEAGKNRCAIS